MKAIYNGLQGISTDYIREFATKNVWTPIVFCTSVYSKFAEVVGRTTVLKYAGIPFIASVLSTSCIYYLEIYQSSLVNKTFENYLKLGDTEHKLQEEVIWQNFSQNLQTFALIAFSNAIFSSVISIIQKRCEIRLARAVQEQIDKTIFSDQALVAYATLEENKSLMLLQRSDTIETIKYSSEFLASSVTAGFSGILGIYSLYNLNWVMPVYSFAYGFLNQKVTSFLLAKTKESTDESQKIQTQLDAKRNHALGNARSIVETQGETYIREDASKLQKDTYAHEDNTYWWSQANELWGNVSGYFNWTLRTFMMGYYLKTGVIKVGDRSVIEVASEKINDLVKWNSRNMDNLIKTEITRGRLEKIFNISKQHENRKRELSLAYNSSANEIEIQNLHLEIGGNNILSIPSLKLKKGKVYALKGDTGSGKSSFLAKLRGIDSDAVKVKGIISFPATGDKEVVMIPQQDFFPLGKSLIETICYPYQIQDGARARIVDLLREANLESLVSRVDEVSDFTKTISGGQKKAIKVISAILQQPKVLLMDETLTGLDRALCATIQQLIKFNLPQATVLVVDHQIDANNISIKGKQFYDEVLTFENQAVSRADISR